MNRTQLIEKITEHTGVEKKSVATVLNGLGEVVLASVSKGDSVLLPGIAKFTKVKRKARIGRNPATGAAVKVPAKTVAKVTALKQYKETVLGNQPAPKLQRVAAATTATRTTRTSRTAAATPAKPARATKAAAAKPARTSARATKAAAQPVVKATAKPRTAAKAAARPVVKAAAKPRAAAKPAVKAVAKAPARPRTAKKG